jgi:predicted ABC-type exoprotein transport system permease subunit
MQKEHQGLIVQYRENEKAIEKSQTKTIILEIIIVGIVIYMKSVQGSTSLKANVIGTSFALVILCLHFLDFYPRRALHRKSADIVLRGVKLEKQHSSMKESFFSEYIKNFNALGLIAKLAIFDIIFIYFFSVSYTQLLKAMNPDVIAKLRSYTPISTGLICFSLGWAYYKAIRPLAHFKRDLEAS